MTSTELEQCGSRGPRIGNEGVPICMLPKMHDSPHVPDESWFREIRCWTDHALCGRTNMDVPEPAVTSARVPSHVAVKRAADHLRRDSVRTADEVAFRAAGDLLNRIHETWSDVPTSVKLDATILARALTDA